MTKDSLLSQLQEGVPNCLTNSAPGEPVFVLVGRDKLAAGAVRAWAAAAEAAGVNRAKVAEARALATQMDDWRRTQGDGGKLPD